MTHRRFNFDDENYWVTRFRKHWPAKELRLLILHKALTKGAAYLNTLGGFANDEHVQWLVDRKLVRRKKILTPNCCSGMPEYLSYQTVVITEKGKKYYYDNTETITPSDARYEFSRSGFGRFKND